jgi:hypothetical protein
MSQLTQTNSPHKNAKIQAMYIPKGKLINVASFATQQERRNTNLPPPPKNGGLFPTEDDSKRALNEQVLVAG